MEQVGGKIRPSLGMPFSQFVQFTKSEDAPMERQTPFLRMLFILIACLTVAACKPEVRATALHMGDSLMQESAVDIQFLEVIHDEAVLTVFNAISGSGLKDNDYWIPRIANIRERIDLDLVFISLGANDVRLNSTGFPDEEGVREQINEILASFAPETVILWIPPHSNIENLAVTPSQYITFRQALEQARDSGDWPNLAILDFDIWLETQDEDLEAMLDSDGIHLSGQGQKAWASMIHYAINTFFPI